MLSTDLAMSSTLPGLLLTLMTPSLHPSRFTRAPNVTNSLLNGSLFSGSDATTQPSNSNTRSMVERAESPVPAGSSS
eukprot:12406481-Karenia_brevis.AAC.1